MSDKNNKTNSRKQAMLLKCWDCTGNYADGMKDCEVRMCPLYQWMPYRKKEPDLSLFNYSPKRLGMVTLDECRREMTEEQREAAAERLRNARNKTNG